MPYYYVVPAIMGEEALVPDIPSGMSWVGCPSDDCTSYLIKTNVPIENLTPLTDDELRAECIARGLNYADVLNWQVG